MGQQFRASPTDTLTWWNGAIGHSPGGSFDCLGHFAKVRNCPVIVGDKVVARLTCYATGYADTAFSVPANTRRNGKHVRGYFTWAKADEPGGEGYVFRVMDSHKHLFA